MKVRLDGDEAPTPVVETPANEGAAGMAMSPDGRWLAYTSNVTGRAEIWVRAYPGPGAPVRVSPAGGQFPVWARSGRELYYMEGTLVKAVAVSPGAEFNFAAPVALFNTAARYNSTAVQPPVFDVTPDGRFVFVRAAASQTEAPMTIVLNWMESLRDQ